ncbi:MAG: PHP domain-containing protein [Ignavibacteria bacterium]|nr:PHP domain-containing protein [Ignavibacteria bacterium]
MRVYIAVKKHTDREKGIQDAGKNGTTTTGVACQERDGISQSSSFLIHRSYGRYYYKPRIDMDLLREYHEGLIATSAGLAGPINALMLAGDEATAKTECDHAEGDLW